MKPWKKKASKEEAAVAPSRGRELKPGRRIASVRTGGRPLAGA